MTKVQFVAVLRLGDRNHFRSMKKLELFLHPLEGKLIQRRLPSVLPRPPRYFLRTPNNSQEGGERTCETLART